MAGINGTMKCRPMRIIRDPDFSKGSETGLHGG